MQTREILVEAYGRIRSVAHQAAEGLSAEALVFRPEADANSVGWLVWHLTRIQDDHLSEIADREQAWIEEEWYAKLGMAPDRVETGRGHTSEQVAAVRPPDATVLLGYHDAVIERSLAYLETVDEDELDRIIDRSYDPPVSVGVRLVSVISDNLQHAGQARYVRGILDRQG